LASGALVAAHELGGDGTVPASDGGAAEARLRADPQASRSGGRTPSATTTATPTELRRADRTGAPTSSPPAHPSAAATPEPGARRPGPAADTDAPSPRPDVLSPQVSSPPVPAPEVPSPVAPSGEPSPTGTPPGSSPEPTRSGEPRDRTPPQTTIVSGPLVAVGSAVGDDSEFTFKANEAATFTCSLDDQPFRPCASPHEYDDLGPGQHEFEVRATDSAGNVDPSPDVHRWVAAGLDDSADRLGDLT
jgi:hypothetical protein